MALPRHFFFYGTLGEGMDNPVIAAIRPKLGPGRRATVRGALYAIPERDGWYPALLAGDQQVDGHLYAVGPDFSATDLASLDRYEAYDPRLPEESQYVRTPWEVETVDGWRGEADVYRRNEALPATSRPIGEGNFAAFLSMHGFKPLAPRD